nr:MAG TPA: hypothetical protein [Caudoviricetes sp.]
MRFFNKYKHRDFAKREFNEDPLAVVVSDTNEFHELTGQHITVPLYIIDGLTKAGKLNNFLRDIEHEPLDTAPYYTVLQSLMQGTELTYTDKVLFLAMVAKIWDWNERFSKVIEEPNLFPNYSLIGYIMGLTVTLCKHDKTETDEFFNLVYHFFCGDIDTPTFFTECDNLKKQ